MVKKRNRGDEERDNSDGTEAARAARRAARDKIFGKSSGEPKDSPASPSASESNRSPARSSSAPASRSSHEPIDEPAAGAPTRGRQRELPMSGSARELRRLRRGPDLAAMLEQIKCDEMAAEIARKRRLLYIALGLVAIALVVFFVARFYQWTLVASITKFSILAAPICIAFGINDLCLYIARTNPNLARRMLTVLSLGNPHTVRTLAWLYVDTGDYAKAEKIIASAVRTMDPKKKLRDYILTHAFLANLRAHVGRTEEAEQLVREVLNAAEDHNKQFQSDGSAFLLANTLNYAAQLCDQKDKIQDALALSRRAVRLLCDHKKAPADVCLVALSNAGYYCNVLGEYQDAMIYLTKALELATKTQIARDGQWAFIHSNLAIANLGIGRSTMCKRHLNDAETRALAPLGLSERPHTYQCWAIYHFANDRLEYALQSYERAIEYCSLQNPRDSVLLLRIIKEYSVLLREVGKVGEASINEQKATQIRDTLFLNATKRDKKQKKAKPVKLAVPKGESRFPIFWTLSVLGLGWLIWEEGLRLAPLPQWMFLVTSCVLTIVKIWAKYGPTVREESSQGAIVAVVSLIPGLRGIVPELSVLPQKAGAIIIGTAIAVLVFVGTTKPPPDTVPDSGLTSYEYRTLGDRLIEKDSFTKARKAYELALGGGRDSYIKHRLLLNFPKNDPSPEAIDDNMRAVGMWQLNPKEAGKIWKACIRKYPNFEYPYVNLAKSISPHAENKLETSFIEGFIHKAIEVVGDKKEVKSDLEEADTTEKSEEAARLLVKALKINPNCAPALMHMVIVQTHLGNSKGARKYLNRYIALTTDGQENVVPSLDLPEIVDEPAVGEEETDVPTDDGKEGAKPVKPSSEPKPAKPVSEPKPAKPVSEPKPAKPVSEPKPAKPASEPKPAKSVSEPKPAKPVSEPNSAKSVLKPKPAVVKNADDDEWESTPLKSTPIKSTSVKSTSKGPAGETKNAAVSGKSDSKNWLDKAAEDAKKADALKAAQERAAKQKAVQDKIAQEKKAAQDKERRIRERRAKRHEDDWKKLSPDDTDW